MNKLNNTMKKFFRLIPLMLITGSLLYVSSCKEDIIDDGPETNEIDYSKFKDSLAYVRYLDSIARVMGQGQLFYTVTVADGSSSAFADGGDWSEDGGIFGRTNEEAREMASLEGAIVTISQYGVKAVDTVDASGMVTFSNVVKGKLSGSVRLNGYTPVNWITTVGFSWEIDVEIGEEDELITLTENKEDVQYGNIIPVFALQGNLVGRIAGRMTIESDLTNKTRELVPTGTSISAHIVTDDDFVERFLYPEVLFDSQYRGGFINQIVYDQAISTAASDGQGNYNLTIPTALGGLPIQLSYSDVIADQTLYENKNNDVTSSTYRNIFGPSIPASGLPAILGTPTVTFDAGGGAIATAIVSGDGSISSIQIVSGGENFNGTPRVVIDAPAAGGTQAEATATVTGGILTGITITNPGSGYTFSPGISITEGFGAEAHVESLVINATNGGVASVRVVASGFGYVSNPFVIFDGLPSVGNDVATATANRGANGTIASITMVNKGSAYGGSPSVRISSGENGIGTAAVVAGEVVGIAVTDAGEFYSSAPIVTLTGGGGTGATATATVNAAGAITAFTVTNGGTGYVTAPGVLIEAVGEGAIVEAVWEGAAVGEMEIDNPGNWSFGIEEAKYINVPDVVFGAPEYTGPGSARATGTAVIENGLLVGINLTNAGFGYYGAPSLEIVSGSGALVEAQFSGEKITGFNITNGGDGYLAAPDVVITGGGGSGATATAVITNGRVTQINVTAQGGGYINPGDIDVTFLDPEGAEGEAVVEDGEIVSISVTRGGFNYKVAPRVIITSGGVIDEGNSATATSTVAAGSVTTVTVTNGGKGYFGANRPNVEQEFSTSEALLDNIIDIKPGVTKILDLHYGTGQKTD